MKEQKLIDSIIEKLSILSTEIRLKNSFNMLDINVVAEDFFAGLLNIIFDYKLKNINHVSQNTKAIDLVDDDNKKIVQVSSDNSKKKVQKSLSNIDASRYTGYQFFFVNISKDVDHLKNYQFEVPTGISFVPTSDCYSIKILIQHIQNSGLDKIAAVSEYLNQTIIYTPKSNIRPEAITYVIKCLANVNFSNFNNSQMPSVFDIQPKIDKNKLEKWNELIHEYYVYSNEVDKIYRQFDAESMNQSMAVLFKLNELYLTLKPKYQADDLFDKMKDEVYNIVDGDATCSPILTKEQLELNISLVLIDAFIKCKIFEKPE